MSDSDLKLRELAVTQREHSLKNQEEAFVAKEEAFEAQKAAFIESIFPSDFRGSLGGCGGGDGAVVDLISPRSVVIQSNLGVPPPKTASTMSAGVGVGIGVSPHVASGSEPNDNFGHGFDLGFHQDSGKMTKLNKTIQAKIDHNQSLLDKLQIRFKQLKMIATQLQVDKDRYQAAMVELDRARESLEAEKIKLSTDFAKSQESLEAEKTKLYADLESATARSQAQLASDRQAILDTRLNIPRDTNLVVLAGRLSKRAATVEEMKSHGVVTPEEFNQIVLVMTDTDFTKLASRWPLVSLIKFERPMTAAQVNDYVRVMGDDEFRTKTADFQEQSNKLKNLTSFFGDTISLTLPLTFTHQLITMSDAEFESKTKHLHFIKWALTKSPGSMNLVQLQALVSLSEPDLVETQDYLCLPPIIRSVVIPCSTNFSEWGSYTQLGVEFKFPSLRESCKSYPRPFCNLLDLLYPRKDADGDPCQTHTHPTDPSITESRPPILPYCSGSVPRLSSNPKLFFSTPHIAGGDWIQFHGPGTTLFDVGTGGPDFRLMVGGLCPKGKERRPNFLSAFGGDPHTDYQISIKWA